MIWIIKSGTSFEKLDRQHSKYYNYYTGQKWGDAVNYDICFNSASYGIEESVEIIEAYAEPEYECIKKINE